VGPARHHRKNAWRARSGEATVAGLPPLGQADFVEMFAGDWARRACADLFKQAKEKSP